MKPVLILIAAVSNLSLAACATAPVSSDVVAGTASGAAAGAAKGAAVGSVVPGVGTAAGAVAGAVAGGVAGAVIGGHQYYRDTRGYCYYVDPNGQPQYNYSLTC